MRILRNGGRLIALPCGLLSGSHWPSLFIPGLDGFPLALWKFCIHVSDSFRVGDHLCGDGVYNIEEVQRDFLIVLQIDHSRMYCLVPNHADYVKRLLDKRIQPLLDQAGNVIVDVLTPLSEVFAEFLDAEAQKRCGSARRCIDYLSGLLKIPDNVIGKVGIWLRSCFDHREQKPCVDPHRYLLAVVTDA